MKRGGRIKYASSKRAKENRDYLSGREMFLFNHPICPVTGDRTTQIHHSAKREGGWLNLQRYWIAVSAYGHSVIEENKTWAGTVGLMVRINVTYKEHLNYLIEQCLSTEDPVFYDNWKMGVLLEPPVKLLS